MTRKNEFDQSIGDDLPDEWQPPPYPPRHVIKGSRILVEPLNPDRHYKDLFEANSLDRSGEGWTYLNYGPFHNLPEYRTWMEETCLGDDLQFWSYVDSATGNAAGLGSYLRITPNDGVIEVGHLRFSPKLQRATLATEAMYLKMKNVFDLGYRRYEWKCDALNTPPCRAAERYGFRFEGVFRQATHYKGRNRDTAWFAVIDKEWPSLKSAYKVWPSPENFDSQGVQLRKLGDLIGEHRAQF